MKHPLRGCVRASVDAHFSGAITPATERAMRAHLSGCEGCRRYYERRLLLASLDSRAIGPEQRIAVGLGLRTRRRTAPLWSAAFAACALAAVLVVVPLAGRPSEFAARGAPRSARPDFFAYRIHPAGQLVEGSTMSPTDDLAFAYTNPSGFQRLLVYGVDEHRHIYWYYPAWSNPADDPHAVTLSTGPEVRELPDAIRQDLDGAQLTIVAVFLDDDTSVRRVERLVADLPAAGDALPIAGSYERRLTLQVGR
jgi:hypothetical protein